MANITYLIGAGASAKALPVVSNWNERLEDFFDYLKQKVQSPNNVNLKFICNEIERLMPMLKGHSTVDTFAKKLFF